MLALKLLALVLILVVTLLSAVIPFWRSAQGRQHSFPNASALAAGVFLGAGLIHMLGDAAADFIHQGYDYPFAFLLAGAVFLLLLYLEHLGRELYEHQGGSSAGFAVLAMIMLSIHSFLAGASLGFSNNYAVFILILFAILAHKWAASFSLALQLVSSNLSRLHAYILFAIFAMMVPLGILFGGEINHTTGSHALLTPIFSSMAAGTFLYLGTLHGLNRAVMVEKCCNLRRFMFVVLGFAIMAVVAIWT